MQDFTNDEWMAALVAAGVPDDDVEYIHTGGGINNVVLVLHRGPEPEASTPTGGMLPEADVYIMFSDFNTDECGLGQASLYDCRGERADDGWSDSLHYYGEDERIAKGNLEPTLAKMAWFYWSEYEMLRATVEIGRELPHNQEK